METDNRSTPSEPLDCRPIGRIRTPFSEVEGTPIQPVGARGVKGRVELFDEFAGGLKDLEGFSHIFLLYWFHRCCDWSPEVIPFMDDQPRGILSTRAPARGWLEKNARKARDMRADDRFRP